MHYARRGDGDNYRSGRQRRGTRLEDANSAAAIGQRAGDKDGRSRTTVGREGMESGIERSSDLGKCEAVNTILIGHERIRRLRPLWLVRLSLMRTLTSGPVCQAMGNTHLLGKYQQKRQQAIGKGAAEFHV